MQQHHCNYYYSAAATTVVCDYILSPHSGICRVNAILKFVGQWYNMNGGGDTSGALQMYSYAAMVSRKCSGSSCKLGEKSYKD